MAKRKEGEYEVKKRFKRKLTTWLVLTAFLMACQAESDAGSLKEMQSDVIDTAKNITLEFADTAASALKENTRISQGFDLSQVPDFEGIPSTAINGNIPFFTEEDMTTEVFETYSELDSLGRCGAAYANICNDIMPNEPRQSIGEIKPTAWKQGKYLEVADEGNPAGYLYNRCHLIAFELAGENANEKNLITGTRYMNIEGMLPYENMIAEYVRKTNHHVLYRCSPIFKDDELLARGVLIEAKSVEDDAISLCVFCYNVQPKIEIDYKTGANHN